MKKAPKTQDKVTSIEAAKSTGTSPSTNMTNSANMTDTKDAEAV